MHLAENLNFVAGKGCCASVEVTCLCLCFISCMQMSDKCVFNHFWIYFRIITHSSTHMYDGSIIIWKKMLGPIVSVFQLSTTLVKIGV